MAEYKYRALGWQDDDIASLNVVDATADDNQVELQITKQGEGGTISGPAIIGTNGITIGKSAEGEKIEISGSGYVQKDTRNTGLRRAYTVNETGAEQEMMPIQVDALPNNIYSLVRRDKNVSVHGLVPDSPIDTVLLNKKYVDDNYVKKDTTTGVLRVYGVANTGGQTIYNVNYSNGATNQYLPRRDVGGAIYIPDSSIGRSDYNFTAGQEAVNKKYVDEADKDLRLKLTNLEQALNGYILDTAEEAYADLDSAVLKDNVTVGDNVYPIADKTRALVTRIEGKTTKMVQLLDKSKFPATTTPVAGVTVTKTDDGGLHILGTVTSSGGRNSWGTTVNVEKGHKYLGLLKGNNKLTTPFITLKSDTSQYFTIADIATSTIEGECLYGFNLVTGDYDETIYPQLFDLTAMNREDITTVEQFKAEFPELYPYENGNIYPAKISGVKFTGKNLLRLELEPSLNAYNATASVNSDILSITPTITELKTCYAQLKTHLKAGKYTFSAVINNPNNVSTQFILSKKVNAGDIVFQRYYTAPITFTIYEEQDFYILIYPIVKAIAPFKTASYQMQIQAESQATAYEPYIEPVSVTLPQTYDLHGIGDYKDYLEITKNEDNELYTLKKVQQIGRKVLDGTEIVTKSGYATINYQSYYLNIRLLYINKGLGGVCNKMPTAIFSSDIEHVSFGISNNFPYLFLDKETYTTQDSVKEYLAAQYAANDPLIIYYILETPVETVVSTNLTYEQVTAIRNNGGLIEAEGNSNKGYAKPTVTNTIVYRLTAANTTNIAEV